MARIRTIKPELFTSEDTVSLSPLARLLYIAPWCEADKTERLGWRPAMASGLNVFATNNGTFVDKATQKTAKQAAEETKRLNDRQPFVSSSMPAVCTMLSGIRYEWEAI